jgi:hypothetical protein
MKTTDIDSSIVDILNNYNHPLFEIAYQMLDDSKFLIEQNMDEEDDEQHLFEFSD